MLKFREIWILLYQKNEIKNLASQGTVFALAVMEYAGGVSKFGKNTATLLVHQY